VRCRARARPMRKNGPPGEDRAPLGPASVLGCDYNVIPSPERIEDVADESDLVEVMNTEQHLLYVACTRARDFLLVTGVDPASEFLDDLEMR